MRKNDGFTILEITICVTVVAILMAVLLPRAIRFVDESKTIKANKDIETLAISFIAFQQDLNLLPRSNGHEARDQSFDVMFLGDSIDLPEDTARNEWRLAVIIEEMDPEKRNLFNHFSLNDPNHNGIYNDPVDYPVLGTKRWQGPYFDRPDTTARDPWGNAYVVSFFRYDRKIHGKIVSAGPNGRLETLPFFYWESIPREEETDDIVRFFEAL
jgi:prepilin-type N-terminal cleavage/methylation domain-containing protein